MSRPIPHRSSQFSRAPFFCHSFSRALLRANSCLLQLRVFCFPGSSPLPYWVPSDKAAARFGSSSHSLLGAPRKWGKKKEIQKMSAKTRGISPSRRQTARTRFFRRRLSSPGRVRTKNGSPRRSGIASSYGIELKSTYCRAYLGSRGSGVAIHGNL